MRRVPAWSNVVQRVFFVVPARYKLMQREADGAARSEGSGSELGLNVQNVGIGGALDSSEALRCGGFGWEYPWDGSRLSPALASGG